MAFDRSQADLLIQYFLLVAGENDEPPERQLGPIHLIKYVYLGDLAHAHRFEGQSFTGADWRFHKFGPWSQDVNQRVEPALLAIGAIATTSPSDYEGKEDWTRWSLSNEHLLRERERTVPPCISLKVVPQLRKFGKDTRALLDFVYRTPPMLNAAPGEHLDLSIGAGTAPKLLAHRTYDVAPVVDGDAGRPLILREDYLLDRDLEAPARQISLRDRIRSLRKQVASPRRRLVNPVANPRYDEVYRDGLAWLDTLAGEPLRAGEYVAEFEDSVWKSPARKGDDVP